MSGGGAKADDGFALSPGLTLRADGHRGSTREGRRPATGPPLPDDPVVEIVQRVRVALAPRRTGRTVFPRSRKAFPVCARAAVLPLRRAVLVEQHEPRVDQGSNSDSPMRITPSRLIFSITLSPCAGPARP